MLEKRLRKPRLRPASEPDRLVQTPSESPEKFIALGRVIKAHGLRGQVKVIPLTDSPDRFFDLRSVFVESRDGTVTRRDVEKVKIMGDTVVLTLVGIEDRTPAEALVGSWISVPLDEVAPLEEGRYYAFDLMGMDVVNEDSGLIGKITRIEEFPANAVLVVESETEEIWVPAVKEFLVSVDMELKRLTVRLPEGLPTYPKQTE